MPKDQNLSTESPASTKNYILNSLPKADFERLLPDLEPVRLVSGEMLYRPNEPINYVYFPNDAMASIVATTAEGQCAEIGVIGREGIVGIDVLLGSDSSPNETFIQLPDGGLRMKTAVIRERFTRRRRAARRGAEIHPFDDASNQPDGVVQSSAHGRRTPGALAFAVPRPRRLRPTAVNAGVSGHYARHEPRDHHGGGDCAARRRIYQIHARANYRSRPRRIGTF